MGWPLWSTVRLMHLVTSCNTSVAAADKMEAFWDAATPCYAYLIAAGAL